MGREGKVKGREGGGGGEGFGPPKNFGVAPLRMTLPSGGGNIVGLHGFHFTSMYNIFIYVVGS